MQISEELVNQVVANVLSTLSRQGQGTQAAGSVMASETNRSSVILSEKVITADLLAEKTKGQSVIGITAGALLTPAAKDYLRENKVEVQRATVAVSAQTKQRGAWRAIVLSRAGVVEQSLTNIEQQTGASWSQELMGSLDEAVQGAVSSLCRADAAGAVLFASAAEKAACLANRNQKVCAAAIQDVNHLRTVVAQMSPNLICVNPEQKSFMELRNLMKTFVSAGTPHPEV
ncbi:hypothetical protein [Gimesia panareensis]|uniref:Uncharacterized protein n=1 Tax=Gimesia panareensis TaxID=2527978 RepID=A0A517QDT1_9PLAN|nr:hypothetical protein [Gimesia panareensis]QDT29737.1 hypothetical protein Enr10x_50920 [Gimesia panareensis]QDU52872.1 hypothetical protein Pan110_52540 [Gimesia panareensis]